MASNIDTAIPPLGNATTSGVRANFTSAKTEIEELQTQVGFADYNDLNTATTPISVSASTWTKLTNDKLGANTKIDALPSGVTTNLWNSTTNQLVLSELAVNTMVEMRIDIEITTTAANQIVKLRSVFAIGDPIEFNLEAGELSFKTAGAHKIVLNGSFYIGSLAVKNNPAELQIWADASATVKVNGWYIRVIKYLGG